MNGHSYNSVPSIFTKRGERIYDHDIKLVTKSMTKAQHNSIVLRNKAGFVTNAVI